MIFCNQQEQAYNALLERIDQECRRYGLPFNTLHPISALESLFRHIYANRYLTYEVQKETARVLRGYLADHHSDDECCSAHHHHVEPHKGCILR